MAKKPQRSDFGRGLKGDRMYQNALAAYNRAASGKLSITDKLFGMSKEAKAARVRAANRLLGRYKDGQIVVKGGKKFRWNAKTNQFVPVKTEPAKPTQTKPTQTKPTQTKPTQTKSTQTKPKPTSAKPKPKPKQETVNGKTVTRVGPVSTPADKPKMNKLKIDKAMASTRKAYLKNLQEEAKKKSLEQAKKNRARGNTRPRGPRER